MGWQAILPERLPVRGDCVDDVDCSTLWLLEDGVAIGPPHAIHHDIVAIGKGRYSHWGQGFWFSSSDNSNPNTNGRAYRIAWDKSVRAVKDPIDRCDPIKDMLGEILRRRGVDRIAYFHTDHFEPFPAGQGRDRWIKGLRRFATLTRGRRFGGRLSLFYTPLIVNAPRLRRGLLHVARTILQGCRSTGFLTSMAALHETGGRLRDRSELVFEQYSADHIDLCTENIRPLETDLEHQFHVHLHHEGWTASDCVHPYLRDWIDSDGSHTRDSRSIDSYLATCRVVMEAELGRAFDRWGFIHGMWALNGSNPSYCRIEDELAILKRHGCYGDFTFPAGDRCNDPVLKSPFTCTTPSLSRAYDRDQSSPRVLSRGAGDLRRGRFLIWSSELDATRSSLDLYNQSFLDSLKQPEYIVRDWFAGAPVIDGCLYIKTHAHSMDAFYRLWDEDAIIPHAFPPVEALFMLLQAVADRAHVEVTPTLVDDVVRSLNSFDRSLAQETRGTRHPRGRDHAARAEKAGVRDRL